MFVNMVRSDDKEIVFRRSLAARNAVVLILAAVDVLCYVYFKQQISLYPVGENEYVWCIPILIIVMLNFMGMKYAGPEDLVLDIDRQSYSRTTGYPMFPKVVTGSFGDFYGLCVRPVKNRRGTVVSHRVELDWNAPDTRPLVLAECTTLNAALDAQHDLATTLVSIPVAKE